MDKNICQTIIIQNNYSFLVKTVAHIVSRKDYKKISYSKICTVKLLEKTKFCSKLYHLSQTSHLSKPLIILKF